MQRVRSPLLALALCTSGLATALPRQAVERAVRDLPAQRGRDALALGEGRPLPLPETLTRHGVTSDVEIYDVSSLAPGRSPLAHLFGPRPHVVAVSADGAALPVIGDHKGTHAPALSNHPVLRYGWDAIRQSKLAKAAAFADGAAYAGWAGAALFASPHVLALVTAANVMESVAEKAAYGVTLLRSRPKLRAQHAAVDEVAASLAADEALGHEVGFGTLFGRYQTAIAKAPAVAESERLDAFAFRDWLGLALQPKP